MATKNKTAETDVSVIDFINSFVETEQKKPDRFSLIALMKDQVDALHARQLPATFINSSIAEQEQWSRIEGLRRGQFKLVYVAPERFRSSRFLQALHSVSVSLFAVDEAHCISTWGHDFRPDYLRLKNIIPLLRKPQTLALTATATPYVRSDIIQQLGLVKPEAFVSGFDRPNLRLGVAHKTHWSKQLLTFLADKKGQSGIVYCLSRKFTEEAAAFLQEQGWNAIPYHPGQDEPSRR